MALKTETNDYRNNDENYKYDVESRRPEVLHFRNPHLQSNLVQKESCLWKKLYLLVM